MELRVATEADFDDAVALIAEHQRRPERNIVTLGVDEEGIRAELAELELPWLTTAWVVRSSEGELVATAHAEWDEEVGRVWVHGPWVAGDDDAWNIHAGPLVDAVLTTVPPAIQDVDLSGDVAHQLMAALAERRGFRRGVTNYVLAITAAPPPVKSSATLRPPTADDVTVIAPLHDAEFPTTYYPASQLVARALEGKEIMLCAEVEGAWVGYAAGQVQPDGEGYIDFVAVDPSVRGRGVGRHLVVALTRELIERATKPRVSLTVQEPRVIARALYDALGFHLDAAVVGYRGARMHQ